MFAYLFCLAGPAAVRDEIHEEEDDGLRWPTLRHWEAAVDYEVNEKEDKEVD